MWDEIIAEVQKHPKLIGKPLPDELTSVSGSAWERDSQRIKALDVYLAANGLVIPAELKPFSERDKLASWIRRSAGQSSRRAKETEKE